MGSKSILIQAQTGNGMINMWKCGVKGFSIYSKNRKENNLNRKWNFNFNLI